MNKAARDLSRELRLVLEENCPHKWPHSVGHMLKYRCILCIEEVIERALIEHEKVVREEDATLIQHYFDGLDLRDPIYASVAMSLAGAIRARKPADTEEGA